MAARRLLNVAYTNGTVLLAVGAGVVSESWPVFFVALAGLLVINLYLGQIRGRQR